MNAHYAPELAIREAQVTTEFSLMCKKQAKDVSELRHLMVELEDKKRKVIEIVGEAPNDLHAKSILVGMLDPDTRKHLAKYQGAGVTYGELAHHVLEFINVVGVACAPRNQQIDAVEEKQFEVDPWGS